MTLKVRNTIDFRSWILGWGSDVEVLEPEVLPKSVILIYRKLQDIYFPKLYFSLPRSGEIGVLTRFCPNRMYIPVKFATHPAKSATL